MAWSASASPAMVTILAAFGSIVMILQDARLFDGDNQFTEAAQDVVQHALFFLDVEAPDPARQRGEQGSHLELREVHAKAHVRPGAERHVPSRIVAPEVEAIGLRELSRIAIGGAV